MKHIYLFIFLILLLPFNSLHAQDLIQNPENESEKEPSLLLSKMKQHIKTNWPFEDPLTVTFVGDIMAHDVNFRMKDYEIIYDDVRDILLNDDISFGNLETPVHLGRAYQSYPAFNIQMPYLNAILNAGFDVFTLANNHTNDQGISGILETFKVFKSLKEEKNILSVGIKDTPNAPLTYEIIEKNGWKILFVGVTEILNSYDKCQSYIDLIYPSKKERDIFKAKLKKLREDNPCDMFVVAIHVAEPEYVLKVPEARKQYFHSILDECNVDIIWASHPHVMQEWEIIKNSETDKCDKLIMYSMGNFYSGQRYITHLNDPSYYREYTGDSYMLQLKLFKKDGFYIKSIEPILITTYVDERKNILLKKFTDEFIETLSPYLQKYYIARKKLMEPIKGIETCH